MTEYHPTTADLKDIMAGVKTASITTYIHLAFYIVLEVFDGRMSSACDKARTTILIAKLNHLIHIVISAFLLIFICYWKNPRLRKAIKFLLDLYY